jgi:hypothetical protein
MPENSLFPSAGFFFILMLKQSVNVHSMHKADFAPQMRIFQVAVRRMRP